MIVFPEKEFQIVVALSREDKTNKAFYVYEVFNERMTRKINKLDNQNKGVGS